MARTKLLGLDPGPKPGVVMLTLEDQRLVAVEVLNVDPADVPTIIGQADLVAVERFLVGPGTVRKSRDGSALAMSQAVTWFNLARTAGKPTQYLPAGSVKPWSTDHKLGAWGLYGPTAGEGGHHRDAARHALFMAVRRNLLPVLKP